MYKHYFKRLADIGFSLILLALTSWIVALIIIVYGLTFHKNIFFRQRRIGKDGISFELIKFRTLQENDLPLEQRKFWLGDFLRSTSLDEIPQLLHVLKGEMSLIGPRPLPVEYLPLFSVEQGRRHEIRPGITGWAQVNGRNSVSWEEKFRFDVQYVDHVSFMFDLRIVVKTILLLLSFKKDNSLSEKKFTGSHGA